MLFFFFEKSLYFLTYPYTSFYLGANIFPSVLLSDSQLHSHIKQEVKCYILKF